MQDDTLDLMENFIGSVTIANPSLNLTSIIQMNISQSGVEKYHELFVKA